jgi:uracil-DNA glycosylase family 4
MSVCPVCSERTVAPGGDKDAEILFIASVPGDEELAFGKPFVGFNGRLFKNELYREAGIDLAATRQVYLWFHKKSTKKQAKDCLLVSNDIVDNEMIERKFIILIGSDAVKYFTGKSVDDVNGLDITSEVPGDYHDWGNTRFFALCNPNSAYVTVGELRFGLNKLKEWMEALK